MKTAPFARDADIQMGTPIDASQDIKKNYKPADESIRSESRPYNDVWAAVAWATSVAVVVVFGIMGYHEPKSLNRMAEDGSVVMPSVRRLLLIILTAISSSFFTSMGLVTLTRNFAREVIYASNGMLLGIYVAGIVTSSISGANAGAIGFGIVFCVHLIFLFIFRNRIPFAALCLRTSATIMKKYRGMIYVALGFGALQVGFFLLWGNGLVDWTDDAVCEVRHSVLWLWIFFLFWSLQVLVGVVHATTCGVFAMWYFTGGAMPRNPTVGALRRACTFSFGSICLGSLIVAILKTLCTFFRCLTRSGGDSHSFMRAIARVMLNAIESLMEYFNAYAFVHIAIYGQKYVESAKATWKMVKVSGIQAIVNDDFTNTLSLLHILLCTLLSSLLCGFLFHLPHEQHGWVIPCAIGAGIAFFVSRTVFQVLSSGVMAIFVCYAEKPDALRRINPAFANDMERAIQNY